MSLSVFIREREVTGLQKLIDISHIIFTKKHNRTGAVRGL